MNKILKCSYYTILLVGLVMLIAGVWGICFTYSNVSREKITTPSDASIASRVVRGPLTLWSQVEVIRRHTLESTEGKTFSEMPRQIEKKTEEGKLVLDKEGKPVMVPNTARDIWITATTLTTALNLAIMSYAFSSFAVFIGFILVWLGFVSIYFSSKK